MDEQLRQALVRHAPTVLDEHDLIAIYLVGSRARSDFRDDSDVDLAVLPRSLDVDPLELSVGVAADVEKQLGRGPVDVPNLDLRQLPLLTSLLQDTVLLASSDEPARVAFEVAAMTQTLDFELHAAPLRAELLAKTASGQR